MIVPAIGFASIVAGLILSLCGHAAIGTLMIVAPIGMWLVIGRMIQKH